MEYTKDIILNVQYGKKLGLRQRKMVKKMIDIYVNNKFIINILALTAILIIVDLCMVYNFINILVSL